MTQQESGKEVQEVWALFREVARESRETREMAREMARESREMARESKEMASETARQLRETDKKIEALTGKWGRFVEGMVVPATVTMFRERGIEIDRVFQRVRARKDGGCMEVDILGVNTEYAVLIEVKSTLGIEDVMEHIERMKAFKRFFPEYSDRKIVGAVAGIVIAENADTFAYRQGFFVIGQTGAIAKILNDEGFNPKTW